MSAPPGLHPLARLHGVQTAYHDNDGRRVSASPESLLAALHALGVGSGEAEGLPERVAHRRRTLWERALEPLVVVWTPAGDALDGEGAGTFRLRTPLRLADRPLRVVVGLEAGGQRERALEPASLEVVREGAPGGVRYVERNVPLPPVPPGYHDLAVEVGVGRSRRRHTSLIIAAPERAPGWEVLDGKGSGRHWGLFAPLHALHETDSATPPSYPHLLALADEAAEAGATVVGTLPLLAAFLDRPYEPSPYAPVSRLFWNGAYVRPVVGARAGAAGEPSGPLFDPRGTMAERRPRLEAEARSFFEAADEDDGPGLGGPPELASFRARSPRADDYARFRAVTEARGPWPEWPDRLRARDLRPGDYDREVARYHLYLQYRAERQLARVAEGAAERGVALYLDLPMGVHTAGYDVWRERALFALDATAGAPPDPLARHGQDWGFPPLHPERSRLQRHQYFIESIRSHLRFGRVLRIDHVMQLHRMFWIPAGDAREGVYVRYPAAELYAILSLEAHRAGAVIVGEDLGTVPRVVRRTMRRRGLPGMYVLQFELKEATPDENITDTPHPSLVPRGVRAGALASIGTHDTPTFAGWWWGRDIEIRRELGQIDEAEAEAELRGRSIMREKLVRGLGIEFEFEFDSGADPGADPGAGADRRRREVARRVQQALLRGLGESDAGLVLATLEDLWLETEPQNVPGTVRDTNWRRRARRPLGALSDPAVAGLLRVLNESRKGSQ